MKSVKAKLVAGALVVGLATGGTFAFANTDAGTQLKDWYDKQFNKTIAEDAVEVIEHGKNLLVDAESHYSNSKSGANTLIDRAGRTKTSESKVDINNVLDSHLNDLNTAKAGIEEEMQGQFDSVFKQGKAALELIVTEGKKELDKDYNRVAKGYGEAAISELKDELDVHKNGAVDKLEKAIANAQASLSTQLTRKSNSMMSDAKKLMNEKLTEVKQEINRLKDELVAAQKDLINSAGDDMVTEAKDALADVVDGINK